MEQRYRWWQWVASGLVFSAVAAPVSLGGLLLLTDVSFGQGIVLTGVSLAATLVLLYLDLRRKGRAAPPSPTGRSDAM